MLNASLTDCVFELQRATTADEVNALFKAAAEGPLAGILGYEERPLVSVDYARDTRSAIVDAPSTHGDRRHAAQGLCLVRQRDGLRLPHGRSRLPHGSRGALKAMQHAARNYAIVTAAYWGFTLTDGALRMLVLLHFYRLGYSPFTLAFLFLLYEAAGVAGQPGRRLAGDALRHRTHARGRAGDADRGLRAAVALDPGWTAALAVAWVVVAQGVCGVART